MIWVLIFNISIAGTPSIGYFGTYATKAACQDAQIAIEAKARQEFYPNYIGGLPIHGTCVGVNNGK